jgi:hypothetical protein
VAKVKDRVSLCKGILGIETSLSCGVSRDQGDASCSTLLNRVQILWGLIFITMENHSDPDTSSESEYESSQGSVAGSDCDEDEPSQDLEPEPSKFYDKYENVL